MSNQFGSYELQQLLGRGGMGEVYLAVNSRTGRRVALKLLSNDEALRDPELARRFRLECRLAAQIDHPHVLPVYDYSTDDPPYFVMRYINGIDLASVIEQGPLAPERAVTIVEQIGSALDAAHREDLRHRDVKPSNVMLEPGARRGADHAWLFDWGIAQPIDTGGAPPVTRLDQIVGTPGYIAPERLQSGQKADHRADVYSLAVMLYECLAGRRPFVRDNDMGVLTAHVLDEPDPLPDHVPPALKQVVLKGLAKDREQRYQSAGELGAAARAAIDTIIMPAVRDTPPPPKRAPRGLVWGAVAALTGAAGWRSC
ncbi:hypothetical protein BBK82_43805 [Lentzea guizhouensis]|uniref:non-specific serine/threonine protein kinase n=1 Tax=Lentzea guizhouensis TaxID=1586287 RepID=A0A1B2HVR6_9PSEU|nr:serine/threonine-protein kinase [Lentzea guizhouensis]ANZ41836.1 hypothetical protein BBK82_43805 [Lentzea guizhouensis]